MLKYLRTHALMYEYYRQAQEIVPSGVRKVLDSLFTSKAYQIVNSRYAVCHIVISSHLHFLCIFNIMRIHYLGNNNEFYVCISTVQILENVAIEADLEKGEAYFEGSVKFMKTLNEVLDMLIGEVSIIKANSILSL